MNTDKAHLADLLKYCTSMPPHEFAKKSKSGLTNDFIGDVDKVFEQMRKLPYDTFVITRAIIYDRLILYAQNIQKINDHAVRCRKAKRPPRNVVNSIAPDIPVVESSADESTSTRTPLAPINETT